MVEFHDVEQGSEEWFRLRAGRPTASNFKLLLAKGQGKTRATYMRKIAGEVITGAPAESFSNHHMDRGREMEAEALLLYSITSDFEPQRVGFATNEQAGCSPDALIGNDGLVEIKTALPHILIEHIERDDFPPDHVAQCQGQLWVTGRQWIDIAVYWPGMPLFVKRAERDEEYTANLANEVKKFNQETADLVDRIKAYA